MEKGIQPQSTPADQSHPGEMEASEAPVNVVDGKVLHPDLLPENVKETSYAVRGELYLKAQEMQRAGREIIYTNIGNPQALGLKPPKFSRQVVALALAPFLMDSPAAAELFPADAIARAKQLLGYFTNGLGPYTDTKGSLGVRQEVADFIERRDGHPSDPELIFLSNGASAAVRVLLEVLLRGPSDAVLVPIPQYPLYSAVLSMLRGTFLGYGLNEGNRWGMEMDKMKAQAEEARVEGKAVRAMVFINPGNPTGQCLSKEMLEEVVKFAYDEKLVLLADEVYQENVYDEGKPFVSAKKVLMDMGEPYASSVELASFHTVSKGTIGECGLRGGYMELTNIHEESVSELYKISSVQLCPNTVGQMTMALMLNPPKPGDDSYEMYLKERQDELASLKRRAQMITAAFNSLEGVTCNPTDGAMYSFPNIALPQKAIEAAKALGKQPDTFYCLKLLEATGISTVAGSGFGQESGTFHLRTTILPQESVVESFCDLFKKFHAEFMAEYS